MDYGHHHHVDVSHVDTTTMASAQSSHVGHPDGMNGMDDHGMMMYFHVGLGDRVLFYNWVLSTITMTVFTCLVFFLLAFVYEGLKCYREFLIKKRISSLRSFPISVVGGGSDNRVITETNDPNGSDSTLRSVTRRTGASKVFNLPHVLQSLLHVLQVAMSYTLMLGFMTFNVWICISILFGVGLGYFTFCWRKLSVVDVTEHCH